MDAREAKALEVTGDMRITFKNGEWLVPSQASPSTRYTVNPSMAIPLASAIIGSFAVCRASTLSPSVSC